MPLFSDLSSPSYPPLHLFLSPNLSIKKANRIHRFSAPETETHWIRFSLFFGLPIPEPSSESNQDPNSNSDPDKPPVHPPAHPYSHRTHPVLAIPSNNSKILFWDLNRLTTYFDYIHSLPAHLTSKTQAESNVKPTVPSYSTIFGLESGRVTPNSEENDDEMVEGSEVNQGQMRRPPFLTPYRPRGKRGGRGGLKNVASRLRDVSPASSSTTATSNTGSGSGPSPLNASHPSFANLNGGGAGFGVVGGGGIDKTPTTAEDIKIWNEKYEIRQKLPLKPLKAHKEEMVKGFSFLGRGMAWSRGGEWCVVAGSGGVAGALGRWDADGK